MNSRILPSLALIVAALIVFAYISPTWSGSIAAANSAIAADDQALAAAGQFAAQQNQLASARDAIDPASLTSLAALLPSSVDNVGLILDLNALAARSGLSVANIDVAQGGANTGRGAAAAPTGRVGSVDLSLTASGTFSALQSFLWGIERSARLLDLRDLVVRGSDSGVYTYQMTLRLYWLH